MDIKANKADRVREATGMRTDLPDGTAVAVDYETYYSTAEGYSLSAAGMTPQKYCDDDRFDPYLVSIYGPGISPDLPVDGDGNQLYVGRPEDFRSWDRLADRILLAHNAGFDSVVTDRCIRLGLIPELPGVQWQDTIDLARFLLTPGSLKDSMKYLFGREISKAVRAGMDGRRPSDLTAEEYGDLLRYGGDDAKECRLIWSTYARYWPTIEREISCQNRDAIRRGFRIDLPYAEESLRVLRRVQEEALADLPWVTKIDPRTRTYYKPSSTKALSEEIRLLGVEPPSTFKKDAPEFLAWLETNADIPFIKARLTYASTIQHVKRLENLIASADRDSLVHPGLIYFGAHTGRFSAGFSDASSKGENRNINMLNMPRSAVFKGRADVFGGKGIDLRGMYIPRPGYRFVIFDYSQIEARFALWLAGDDGMLDALRTEGNLYQANAVKMGWCKSGSDIKHTDPETYQMAKRCLTGETLVLVRTDAGGGRLSAPRYRRIRDVTPSDKVWDGQGWVSQCGAVRMKHADRKEIVEVGGIGLTADHKVYVNDTTSRRADEILGDEEAAAVAWGASAGPVQGWAHVRILAAALAGAGARLFALAAREAGHVFVGALRMHRLRRSGSRTVEQPAERAGVALRGVRTQACRPESADAPMGEDAR